MSKILNLPWVFSYLGLAILSLLGLAMDAPYIFIVAIFPFLVMFFHAMTRINK